MEKKDFLHLKIIIDVVEITFVKYKNKSKLIHKFSNKFLIEA